MVTQIQLKRDNSINWKNANPVLAEGEFGVELDTSSFKVGNGSSNWNSLPYFYEYKNISIFQSNSANWNFGYNVGTFVQGNSASWEESADITAITTTVASNSANWNFGYNVGTSYQSISSNLQNTYTTVQQNSASWYGSDANTIIELSIFL